MTRYRLLALTVLVLMFVTAGLASAQDATPAPAPEATMSPIPMQALMPCPADVTATTICDVIVTQAMNMVGVWSVYFNGAPAFIRFNADGTWVTGGTPESTKVKGDAYPFGVSSFDGNGVWTTLDDLLPYCQGGHYRIRIIQVDGKPVALNLGLVDDCFAPRQSDYGYTMLWVGE